MLLLFVLLYQSKLLLHVVHFYRICYQFQDNVPIVKSMFFALLLKRYYCLKWQAEVSVAMWRVAHHILQRYVAILRSFYNPCIRIQLEMRISELRYQGQ